jgi:DNA-binding TFAR19-related protein (PDSD5 family)
MPIGGWGGWNYAIGSSMLLKNAGGQSILIYCILDSDYHIDTEIRKRKQDAQNAGVQLHVWERKEIENYLLVPSAIKRLIETRVTKRKIAPAIEEVIQKMEEICLNLKDEVFDALSAEIYSQDRKLGAGGANKLAREYIDKRWKSFDSRLSIVSGKEVITRVSKWSQDQYGVSLNASAIARQIRLEEIPNEVIAVIEAIEGCDPFPEKKNYK